MIILTILFVSRFELVAQTLASEPQASYQELTNVANVSETLPPTVHNDRSYRANERPDAMYSPLNNVQYTPQSLSLTSQQSGYASLGGGAAQLLGGTAGQTHKTEMGSNIVFHSTSILLPTTQAEETDLAQVATPEEPLMQKVGWDGPPADPFLPVGEVPWIGILLLTGIYALCRRLSI